MHVGCIELLGVFHKTSCLVLNTLIVIFLHRLVLFPSIGQYIQVIYVHCLSLPLPSFMGEDRGDERQCAVMNEGVFHVSESLLKSSVDTSKTLNKTSTWCRLRFRE